MKDYAKAERRARDLEVTLHGRNDEAMKAERSAEYAGVVRIERGPAAYRITFPMLSTVERGTDESRAAWRWAERPMADVKAIPGRRFDKLSAAWIVPVEQSDLVELLADQYGATIEDAADERDRIIAELRAQVAELTAELETAYRHVCGSVAA